MFLCWYVYSMIEPISNTIFWKYRFGFLEWIIKRLYCFQYLSFPKFKSQCEDRVLSFYSLVTVKTFVENRNSLKFCWHVLEAKIQRILLCKIHRITNSIKREHNKQKKLKCINWKYVGWVMLCIIVIFVFVNFNIKHIGVYYSFFYRTLSSLIRCYWKHRTSIIRTWKRITKLIVRTFILQSYFTFKFIIIKIQL